MEELKLALSLFKWIKFGDKEILKPTVLSSRIMIKLVFTSIHCENFLVKLICPLYTR